MHLSERSGFDGSLVDLAGLVDEVVDISYDSRPFCFLNNRDARLNLTKDKTASNMKNKRTYNLPQNDKSNLKPAS